MKFSTKLKRQYPSHLGHVATLPWKFKVQIFCRYLADIEENANKLHFECTDFNFSTRVTVYADCICVLKYLSIRRYSYFLRQNVGGSDLKQRLIEAWSSIPQTVIDEVTLSLTNAWRYDYTSLRQSTGTSLRAFAVTNRLFSETPNATTQQPAFFRATHILSKKIPVPSYA